MKLLLSAQCVLLTALCFVFTPALAQSKLQPKHMYRWVDKNGKVFFSDQVPPAKAELGHTELDNNARVVKVAERAKTKEEIEIYKRLMLIKKQQEQLVLRQKAHDKNLLSSFINLAAMDATHKSKEVIINNQERMLQEMNKKLEGELAAKQQDAASYEIKNTKIPTDVLNRIEDIQKKIIQIKQATKELQQKKQQSEFEFSNDRARFIFLTQAKNSSTPNDSLEIMPSQPGLFSCENIEQCEKAWSMAKEFVQANSTAKISVETDTLFMSEDPVSSADLNLTISKITLDGTNKLQIFLDIRCIKGSAIEKGGCTNAKADEMRSKFTDYLKAKLGTSDASTLTNSKSI